MRNGSFSLFNLSKPQDYQSKIDKYSKELETLEAKKIEVQNKHEEILLKIDGLIWRKLRAKNRFEGPKLQREIDENTPKRDEYFKEKLALREQIRLKTLKKEYCEEQLKPFKMNEI